MSDLDQEKNTEKPKDIICMPTSIKVFRLYGMFPSANRLLNPGKKFYIKFALIALYSSLVLVGCTMHLVKNIKDNTYNHVELDITYIVSMCAGYGLICSYIAKVKFAVQLYLFLSDFSEFKKPIDFEETNKKYNRYSIYHYCYLESIVIFILLGSNIFKGDQCRKENEENNLNEICGLFTYTWMPFNIDFVPVKQMYLFEQLFGAHYVYMVAGLAAWMVLESVEHIASRIRHVTYLFNDALNEEDSEKRRKKFNFAVRYHIAVLELEDKLNKTFSVFMFTHMVMTGAIMGYGVYAYIKGRNLSSFLLAIGWLVGLLMDCHSGQRIRDESDSIAIGLYQANWAHCDSGLKKDILFVLMRCQRQMILKAASFGIMDHPMFLAVLKASYSYITLMTQNEKRDH
uniref:Odorant receptor n=1 Tax=Chrysomela lapponica TaxID=153811 RepID=A0A310SD38_CHRLA